VPATIIHAVSPSNATASAGCAERMEVENRVTKGPIVYLKRFFSCCFDLISTKI
jgi:hypothetical protein